MLYVNQCRVRIHVMLSSGARLFAHHKTLSWMARKRPLCVVNPVSIHKHTVQQLLQYVLVWCWC